LGEAVQPDGIGESNSGRSAVSWITSIESAGTVAMAAAAQAASQTMLFAPVGLSLHAPQSCMPLAVICGMVVAAAAALAWTTDRLMPRASKEPRVSR